MPSPMDAKRSRTDGVSRVSLTARFSVWTIAAGVSIAPNIETVALIYNAAVVPDDSDYGYFPSIEDAARAHAMKSTRIGYRDSVDLVHAIDAFGAQPNGGLIVVPPPPIPANRHVIFGWRFSIGYPPSIKPNNMQPRAA